MWHRVLRQLREFLREQERLYERQLLLNRPWEEEYLHWCWTGERWELHGRLVPPDDGHRRSVTSDGWCPRT
jgi:hypothetical protein